jgi:hypothetical protein
MSDKKQIIKSFSLDEESLQAYNDLRYRVNLSKLIRETLVNKLKELGQR